MSTYALLFDATGATYENFHVPDDKRVYLVRSPAVSQGTATIHDFLSLNNYTIPDGVTVIETDIPPGADVSLAFMARSNPKITLVHAEVIKPRIAYGKKAAQKATKKSTKKTAKTRKRA
jgi:hypothetical protein